MDHAPEEYGEYWAGAIRIAAGAFLAVGGYHLLTPLLSHPEWPAMAFGWIVLATTVLAASFAVSLGLARIVATASGRT